MQADMHNLFPAVGELNADRSNFRFDFEVGKSGQYGECKFNVDFKQRRAKVREEIRGVIARDYLYFNKQHKMKLSKQEHRKYQVWDQQYPADAWEIKRNMRNERIQGNLNPFIK